MHKKTYNKKNKKKILYLSFLFGLAIIPFISLPIINIVFKRNVDKNLKKEFVHWYNSLTSEPFMKKQGDFYNMTCNSETQGIALYANYCGWFWNESLSRQEEPKSQIVDIYGNGKSYYVNGGDYKYAVSGLNKAIFPYDLRVYHGVEYLEIEFWDQLKDFAVDLGNGSWDYSNSIGSELECYGFFSTTLDRNEAARYSEGWNYYDDSHFLPLKQEALFVVDIPRGYKGAAYLADFYFSGTVNNDNQVLINKNCKFSIKDVKKENYWVGKNNSQWKEVNVFYLDLLI